MRGSGVAKKRAAKVGGARPGAGRPPSVAGPQRKALIVLPEEAAQSLAEQAEREGKKLAALCREILVREAKRKR